jgi:basic amino acid/polyamine antiporter, APA family
MAIEQNEGLKREIGIWGLAANSINIIVGAGIFILPVIVAERLGSGSYWAYVICGILMIFIMLCFVEVGTKITRSGGAYSYIEEAFGRYPGFLATNVFIFGAAVMANAAVANGFASTLAYFIPAFKLLWVRGILFFIIFGLLAYLNVKGVSKAIMLVKFNTIAKLTPLILIGIFGLFWIKPTHFSFATDNSMPDLGEISLILIFAFVGAETALNVGGEIKNPRKTIPRGIMISIIGVVILYLLVQVSVQGILGLKITNFRDAPLAETARMMVGPAGVTIVIIGTLFSMFGNISGMVLNMPRVLFAASRDKVVPIAALSKIHPDYKTPYISITVYSALGFLFATLGEFKQLAMLSSASYLIIYLGVVLSVIKFKMSNNYEDGAYRIPGGYIIPGISVVVIIWLLTNLPMKELGAMTLFLVIISALFFLIRIFKKNYS